MIILLVWIKNKIGSYAFDLITWKKYKFGFKHFFSRDYFGLYFVYITMARIEKNVYCFYTWFQDRMYDEVDSGS